MNFFIEIFNENPYSDWLDMFSSLKNEWILSTIKINEGIISIWKILSHLKMWNKKANCSFWTIHFEYLLSNPFHYLSEYYLSIPHSVHITSNPLYMIFLKFFFISDLSEKNSLYTDLNFYSLFNPIHIIFSNVTDFMNNSLLWNSYDLFAYNHAVL